MQVIKEEGSRPIKAWVGTQRIPAAGMVDGIPFGYYNEVPDIEESALVQAKNLARLPFIARNGVALMPDVHAGIGSTVGSVIATESAIIPAAVGVDIGCGMNAVRLSLKASDLPESLTAIRHQIEKNVPLGTGGRHQESNPEYMGAAAWVGSTLSGAKGAAVARVTGGFYETLKKAAPQLGTLGSGNHFIELCLDENQDVWVMLHSGSRGIGNMIGRHYIELAKQDMERWMIQLPDKDLAYFPEGSEHFEEYMAAVGWAQEYAFANRRVMMNLVLAALRQHIGIPFSLTQEAINCHHNYVARENHFGSNLWVTRKGAIRAREGDLGIIPGSMGQRSYIVCGKGHAESYCSCSHGAGRAMSRTEARRRFSLTDLIAQTEGVECRKDDAVLDELPSGYKDIDTVMANQTDLVSVVHTLKQVLCVKGN